MTEYARALQRFFEGFGLPVYAKDDVPDCAELPYITYEFVRPAPLGRASLRAWVWHRREGRVEALGVCGDIREALAEGGAMVEGAYLAGGEVLGEEVSGEARGIVVKLRIDN